MIAVNRPFSMSRSTPSRAFTEVSWRPYSFTASTTLAAGAACPPVPVTTRRSCGLLRIVQLFIVTAIVFRLSSQAELGGVAGAVELDCGADRVVGGGVGDRHVGRDHRQAGGLHLGEGLALVEGGADPVADVGDVGRGDLEEQGQLHQAGEALDGRLHLGGRRDRAGGQRRHRDGREGHDRGGDDAAPRPRRPTTLGGLLGGGGLDDGGGGDGRRGGVVTSTGAGASAAGTGIVSAGLTAVALASISVPTEPDEPVSLTMPVLRPMPPTRRIEATTPPSTPRVRVVLLNISPPSIKETLSNQLVG